jgi:hypothetical protein
MRFITLVVVVNSVLTECALRHFLCWSNRIEFFLNTAIYEKFSLNWGSDIRGGFGIL